MTSSKTATVSSLTDWTQDSSRAEKQSMTHKQTQYEHLQLNCSHLEGQRNQQFWCFLHYHLILYKISGPPCCDSSALSIHPSIYCFICFLMLNRVIPAAFWSKASVHPEQIIAHCKAKGTHMCSVYIIYLGLFLLLSQRRRTWSCCWSKPEVSLTLTDREERHSVTCHQKNEHRSLTEGFVGMSFHHVKMECFWQLFRPIWLHHVGNKHTKAYPDTIFMLVTLIP